MSSAGEAGSPTIDERATARTVVDAVSADGDAPEHPAPPLPLTGVPAQDFANALLVELVRSGVRDLVVAPGSRSQALALAAAELERIGAVRLHVRIDERSAAFFALGLAIETRRAVPVVTTSGTAVAELHPAMLEAFHSGIPLVALTADRPSELVGIGANQATVQPGMFLPHVETTCVAAPVGGDAQASELDEARRLARSIAGATGPLHVDVAFRDPLSAAVPDLTGAVGGGAGNDALDVGSPDDPAGARAVLDLDAADGIATLVVAGSGAGPEASETARAGGWPLIAEVASGARFGRELVVAYRDLLGGSSPIRELVDAVERVLVFGRPTLSREIPALIARDGITSIAVGGSGGESYDPGRAIAQRVDEVRVTPVDASADPEAHRLSRAWLGAWVRASRAVLEARSHEPAAPDIAASRASDFRERARFGRQELEVAKQPVDRELLADAVWRATWPHDRLVLGASRLVRVFDAGVPGKAIPVHAGRGLAGIDGTIATGLGIASASQAREGRDAAGVTRVVVGDLTFLHDAGSLLVGQGGERAPRVQIVVGNDGGGTIFDTLEVAASAGREAMDRVQYTPQRVDLEALARAYGWAYARVTTRSKLEQALSSREHERIVIEVPLER